MIKKKDIKDIISSYFSIADYPILVNSYGRSGSTILTKSIIENANKIKKGPIKKIFSPSISKSAWN
jgi:hypothetical protein